MPLEADAACRLAVPRRGNVVQARNAPANAVMNVSSVVNAAVHGPAGSVIVVPVSKRLVVHAPRLFALGRHRCQGAGAIAMAAILNGHVSAHRTVLRVVTGRNIDLDEFARLAT